MDHSTFDNRTPNSLVYVVDDDPAIRGALTSLLSSVGLQVRAFESAEEFLSEEMPNVPSCLILDLRLRGASGLALQQDLVRKVVRVPIVFLTAHGDIDISVKAMKAGAFDFITKPFGDQNLIDTVVAALKQDEELKREAGVAAGVREAYDSLTSREREVINLVAEGMLNKQISGALGLSEVTVKIHRAKAMQKLHVRSVADLVKKLQLMQPDRRAVN